MATSSILPPQQPKQPSRKGKKAWRKNVDISEVQTGLEEVREEIIKTGGVIAEKPDTALFSLDLKPDVGTAHKHLGRQPRKLRADEILAERSAIPSVDTHSRKRPSGAVVGTGVTKKAKHKNDWVAKKEVERLRKLAFNTQDIGRPSRVAELGRMEYDPWAVDEDDQEEETEKKLDFLEERKEIRAPESMRHPPIALAEVGEVPAVRKPEAGISYNPEFAKWDELLRTEGEKAVEEEKKRLAEEAEERRIQELTKVEEGMQVADDEEEEEENEKDDDEEESIEEEPKKPIEPKRKTQAQRNKEARRKAAEQALAHKKALAKQNRELLLIRKYARTVDARNRARAGKSKTTDDDLENPKIMRRKRLGMVPLSKAPLELQLPDELSESLRRLKPEGNLLRDRFRSLQERGKVETRAPVVAARKVKRKATEKWSYKDFK